MVSIGLTLLLVTVGRRALYFVSGIITVPDGFINLWSKLRFVAVALLMFVLVTVLYMLALGRRCPLREVAPGVAVSLAAWMLLSLAFSYYVENLAHYTPALRLHCYHCGGAAVAIYERDGADFRR